MGEDSCMKIHQRRAQGKLEIMNILQQSMKGRVKKEEDSSMIEGMKCEVQKMIVHLNLIYFLCVMYE